MIVTNHSPKDELMMNLSTHKVSLHDKLSVRFVYAWPLLHFWLACRVALIYDH